MGVLVLREGLKGLEIGLRDVDFPAALRILRTACASGHFLADDEPANPEGAGWIKILQADRVKFVLPDGRRIDLECYQNRAPNYWLSQNRANRQARAIYVDLLDRPGLHLLSDILPAPSLERRMQDEPVDVVYTWVNHRDAEWAAAFRKQGVTDSSGHDATSLSRFHSVDELRYSLRSVAHNLSWARRIHVLTNCAPPDWLDRKHERIRWVRHEHIIPSEYLPTFSSHVIESYLHRIPELTGRFIYMNDDFFLASAKEKTFFFGESGNSRAFLEADGVVSGPPRGADPDYLNASRNSARLLMQEFGIWPTRLHKHAAYALNRDILAEIEEKWIGVFNRFRPNKFRSIQDLNLTSFLYHHYALATGRAEVASLRLSVVIPTDLRWQNRLKFALENDVDALCINEGGTVPPAANWYPSVARFLQHHFPRSAPWER